MYKIGVLQMDNYRKVNELQKRILERMHQRTDFILLTYKEYLDALAEFDRTGILKIHGKILYVKKYEDEKDKVDITPN